MNEYGLLMRLLTRSGDPIGAGVEDMMDVLGLPEDTGRHVLFQKLSSLHQSLEPLGLVVKHNPIDHVFYVDTSIRDTHLLEDASLPDRLAATLLVVITLAYQQEGWVSIERVSEFRRKAKRGVREDLRELSALGYVEFDDKRAHVRPGSRSAFEIDYEEFFRRLIS
ncbi:MAG: hypothetical protein ACXADO_08675 [Candidatus Thorarchaeota archaeon]|jgi:hypothetical protein